MAVSHICYSVKKINLHNFIMMYKEYYGLHIKILLQFLFQISLIIDSFLSIA